MAQLLKALATLVGYLASVPSIHTVPATPTVAQVLGDPSPSSGLHRYCMHVAHIHAYKTPIHKKLKIHK